MDESEKSWRSQRIWCKKVKLDFNILNSKSARSYSELNGDNKSRGIATEIPRDSNGEDLQNEINKGKNK